MDKKKKAKPINTWPRTNLAHGSDTSLSQPADETPTSPPVGRARRSESDWQHKVSVCHLECRRKNIYCQCVVVKLGPELRSALQLEDGHSMTLALIAPHTYLHISNPRELREWHMQTGADCLHKQAGLKLHERYISCFYTCCGPQGVWSCSEAHRGDYVKEGSCPFHANFTVLILKSELTDRLKEVLTIPCLPSLNESHFSQTLRSGNHHFRLIQRGRLGVSESHEVLLKPLSPLDGNELSTDQRIMAYTETAQLKYTFTNGTFFDTTSAGAGVVYFDQTTPNNALTLAAIHLYMCHDDEEIVHYGISLPAIFHAIAGSRVCGVVPCLSLLVGACNLRHWKLRFYHDLQRCLQPKNDPADKQRRYHWTSQLLKLCDYLSRDEGRAVIRLDVTHNPRVVLASVNLLSALLGCFERVIDAEGVYQFHCQISRVFLKKASERFYQGLEGMFKRLYQHLVNPSTGDDVITGCVECWLKICAIAGTKLSALYDVAKLTRVRLLRDSPRFLNNAYFQRLFGDLCLVFLTHTKVTPLESDNAARIQQLEQEKQQLQAKLDSMYQELHRKNQQWIGMPNGVRDDPDEVQISKTSGGCKVSCSDSFWESDMVSQLEKDCVLRESVGRVFQKVTGAAGHATWEDLVHHLEERLDVNNLVELERLSALQSEGDRILVIVQEWSRREGITVTVSVFHGVSLKLGNGRQIYDIMSEVAERDNTLPSLPDPLLLSDSGNSEVEVI